MVARTLVRKLKGSPPTREATYSACPDCGQDGVAGMRLCCKKAMLREILADFELSGVGRQDGRVAPQ